MKRNKSNVLDVIKIRRSVRTFNGKPIEPEKMQMILEAARLAPSSCNSQPWHFVVVDDRGLIDSISRAHPAGPNINKFIKDAAAIIVCVDEPKLLQHKALEIIDRNNQRIDVGIAVEHMVLVAAELGIGSCWIGWFNEKKIKEILKIPKNKSVSVLLALGYPKNETSEIGIGGIKPRSRKAIPQIASRNYFGKNY